MRRAVAAAAAISALVAAFLVSGAVASQGGPGFKTEKSPYLIPSAPGVVVDPIISVGDTVPGSETQPPYQMTGIPDGLGAYRKKGNSRFGWLNGGGSKAENVVVMNHETGVPFPNMPPGVNARVSRLVIDRNRRVHDAEYLITGFEGYSRFCSSTLRIVGGRPWYFTGEEAVDGGHFGSSIALDPETGAFRDTRHFGLFQHENVVPLRLKKWVFLSSEDDFRYETLPDGPPMGGPPIPSYLYAWIGDSFSGSIRGADGKLHVWKPDNEAMSGATAVKNVPIPGRFVHITQAENADANALKVAATAKKAFKFDRLEDIAVFGGTQSPARENVTYIADTGKAPRGQPTARGRIYRFVLDRNDPTRATLTMVLNGDAPSFDDVVNPDNMDSSEKVLVIQEDRESAFRGVPSRVLVWDYNPNHQPREVARVAKPETASRFNWESSGVIDASELFGKDWWLLDVQAHPSTTGTPPAPVPSELAPQPGPSLHPDSSVGEDGQLLAIKISGSQGNGGDDDDDDGGDDDDDD